MPTFVMPVGNSKIDHVFRALINDIQSGKYQVGDKLPSENELTAGFGVSRNTVRSVLGRLQEAGLISTQRGMGSIVRANTVQQRYTQSFESVSDLQRYTVETRTRVVEKEEITIDRMLADWLGCSVGEKWWRIATLRYSRDDGVLVAYSEIYIPYVYGMLLSRNDPERMPIYRMIEEQRGESIAEVQQTIAAVGADAKAAKWLGISTKAPVLLITRRYYSRSRQLLEVSHTRHPADSFNYSMSVRLTSDGESKKEDKSGGAG